VWEKAERGRRVKKGEESWAFKTNERGLETENNTRGLGAKEKGEINTGTIGAQKKKS